LTDYDPKVKRLNIPKPADFTPELVYEKGHKRAGEPRCLAWRPKLGRQCGERAKKLKGGGTRPHPAAPGTHMSVCWRDGGNSLRAQAHPGYKNGKWSAFVPEPLLPTFTKALESGDLLSGMRKLALLAAREEMLLKRLDTGESGKTWEAVRQQWDGLARAREAADDKAIGEHLVALNVLINRGTADAQAWKELGEVWEQGRKIAETEMKRREKARTLVPMEDMLWHTTRLGDHIRQSTLEYDGFKSPAHRQEYLAIIVEGYDDILGSRVPKPILETEGKT
jgi:hypothetical protein